MSIRTVAIAGALLAGVVGAAQAEDELTFGASVVIIELTDNDIELQAFVDGAWSRVKLLDPRERKVFEGRTSGRVRMQGGVSEMFWASQPTHYLEDEPEFDGTIEEFLGRFPPGVYEFEGVTTAGEEIEGEATLTHVMPALPEILSPVSDTDDAPVVEAGSLVIEWEPVTTRFIGTGPVQIIEYQVILDEVDPERDMPWVDGGTRRALINLPGTVTRLSVSPEFLVPGAFYEFEILAIETSGNSTISVGEFLVSE
jgi:hypothetical protein